MLKNAVANHTTAPLDNGDNNGKEVSHPLDNGKVSVLDNEVVAEQLVPSSEKSQNDSHPVSQTDSPRIQDDAPQKSYLSVVSSYTNTSIYKPHLKWGK